MLALQAASISLSVKPTPADSDEKVGLWAVTAAVGAILQGAAFYPGGFGETMAKGYGTTSGRYPSSGCSMQFVRSAGAGR